MVKTHPVPGTSRTRRTPWFASTQRRQIARPSPSPDRSWPRWVNGRNMRDSRVWNALHQKNEGIARLQTNEEPSSCPVAARSYETRKHRAIPRYRSGRRAGDGRADRGVSDVADQRSQGRLLARSGRPPDTFSLRHMPTRCDTLKHASAAVERSRLGCVAEQLPAR